MLKSKKASNSQKANLIFKNNYKNLNKPKPKKAKISSYGTAKPDKPFTKQLSFLHS
jgi:hypothetical protein